MDLRVYYQNIRETVAAIQDEFVIVVSKETTDGGKAGINTEVHRQQAAKLIVDGRARLATKDEIKKHIEDVKAAQRKAEAAAAKEKVQFTVIPESSLEALKATIRGEPKPKEG